MQGEERAREKEDKGKRIQRLPGNMTFQKREKERLSKSVFPVKRKEKDKHTHAKKLNQWNESKW